jgi:asparagine synthase (glutamine-hydrolysing)
VYSLARGSWRELDCTGKVLAEGTYWRFPPVQQSACERSLPDIVEEGRALLGQSVRRHLLSDVRLGIFLSSGLDSTAILGLSYDQNRIEPVDAFTVTFPDQHQYNERAEARAAAARFGARFHECPVSDGTALSWVDGALRLTLWPGPCTNRESLWLCLAWVETRFWAAMTSSAVCLGHIT